MFVRTCDLNSGDFNTQFIDSIVKTGFAVLTGHRINFDSVKNASRDWRQFFLSSEEDKEYYVNKDDTNLGYKKMKSETAVGAHKADLKQMFQWSPGNRLPPRAWASTLYIFSELEELGQKLLSVIDQDDPGKNYAESCWQSDKTLFRSLYYPAMDFSQEPGAVRAAAHEDICMLTLLVAASAPGLEVRDLNGNWHAVPYEENSVVCNVGDMLQLASQGKYKSTTHRVVNPKDNRSDRVSMPLFIHPSEDTVLAPGVTAKQYLAERLEQIYGSRK